MYFVKRLLDALAVKAQIWVFCELLGKKGLQKLLNSV